MGYIKQGENVMMWGQVGIVNQPRVIATKNGNVQVKQFGVCVSADADGKKKWETVECWGVQALREDIKQWQTALVLGREVTSSYVNREGEQVEKKFVRADFISINNTNDDFVKIQKQKEEENAQLEEMGDGGDLPF